MVSGKNYPYQKGVKKERKLVNEARAKGCLAFRSAGSRHEVDVCIIDPAIHEIRFIQAKPETMSQREKDRIRSKLPFNSLYLVKFSVE